jgi:hypothetical protein
VQLPAPLHARFHELCEANGVNSATLLYGWLITAARFANRGHGHRLPRAGRPRRGTIGEVVNVPWRQGDREYLRCRAKLVDAGTDPRTVLRAAVSAYVAAEGDILAMRWPPLSDQ